MSLLDVRTGARLGHTRHPDSVFDVQFSPDDAQLLLASADEFVYVRDTRNVGGNPVACLGHHRGTVRSARWRQTDPHVLVTAGRDGQVAVWDLRVAAASPSHVLPVSVLADIHRKNSSSSAAGKRQAPTTGRSNVVQAEFVPFQEHLLATTGQPDQ